jgi:hypothetical protein
LVGATKLLSPDRLNQTPYSVARQRAASPVFSAQCLKWVKSGKAQTEQILSGLCLEADATRSLPFLPERPRALTYIASASLRQTLAQSDAQAAQPEQSSGDEVSRLEKEQLVEEQLAGRGIRHSISLNQFNVSPPEGRSACASESIFSKASNRIR